MSYPPDRCPLCGESNACGNLAGLPSCWCSTTPIPRSLLARVPEAALNVACVCARCVAAANAANAVSPLRIVDDEPPR